MPVHPSTLRQTFYNPCCVASLRRGVQEGGPTLTHEYGRLAACFVDAHASCYIQTCPHRMQARPCAVTSRRVTLPRSGGNRNHARVRVRPVSRTPILFRNALGHIRLHVKFLREDEDVPARLESPSVCVRARVLRRTHMTHLAILLQRGSQACPLQIDWFIHFCARDFSPWTCDVVALSAGCLEFVDGLTQTPQAVYSGNDIIHQSLKRHNELHANLACYHPSNSRRVRIDF
ncbi:hypothetical protein DAEQUDRAFT_581479 [Daedalea quercina L-15889]|uniref:Uncharacterized protein n=1 Tax=Daedalea quercina L-15889 TaxID=1314783 RepID=A0A165LRA3_9APHY|nr:hypothetical protein DAEQUDRAFT_581479 [Daedalea quercina L-15889]